MKWTRVTCVLLLFAACTAQPTEEKLEVTDREIADAVQSEYWFRDRVDANDLDVTCVDGIVTLSGTVDNLLAVDKAVKIAEATVGVRGVVNRLRVEPAVRRSDKRLETAVRAGLAGNPATDALGIDVKAEEGVITLGGTVDSWQEKRLAGSVAMGIKGVREVRNLIRIEYDSLPSDGEIEDIVEARLENDVLVDDALVSVRAKDGKVILSGTVGSLAEKTRAMTDGWVAGVKGVEGEDLEVEWWMRDRMRRSSTYAARTDEEIEEAVQDAFLYDPRVNAFTPEVTVHQGTVTLNGVVDNLQAKQAAGDDARNVVGVRRVRNHLKVRPETIPPDAELEERVSAVLREDPYLEAWEFDVRAVAGRVYLLGTVDTSWEKNHAGQKAERVKGVVRVVNNVDYEHEWAYKPDWDILQDIRDQLFWSPFVDQREVSVAVQDGVATLSGKVETWGERRAAESNAFEGGAKDVKNELTVTHLSYGPYYGPMWYPPFYPG